MASAHHVVSKLGPGRIAYAVALAGAAIALSYGAVTRSAAWVMQMRAPSAALKVDPDNAVAIVRVADLRAAQADGGLDARQMQDAGRRAVQAAPLSAGGIRLVAMAEQGAGRLDRGARLLELASRVSRRELGTQLILIETAVQRGDIRGALDHYDLALRTNRSAEALLFPILTGTLDDLAVRRELRRIVRSGQPWTGSFFSYAIRAGGHARDVADLIDGVDAGWAPTRRQEIRSALLSGLAADRAFPELRRVFAGMTGADPGLPTRVAFDAVSTADVWRPLAWVPSTDGAVAVGFQAANGKSAARDMSVVSDPGPRVLVARKLMYLPSGGYRLTGALDASHWTTGSTAQWVLRCALTAAEPILWTGNFGGSGNARSVGGDFKIDARCPAQYLDFVVSAAEGSEPLELMVRSPRIVAATAS